jgi:hypothetical protein
MTNSHRAHRRPTATFQVTNARNATVTMFAALLAPGGGCRKPVPSAAARTAAQDDETARHVTARWTVFGIAVIDSG